MVKVKEFAIKLDNEKDNYFAGETLSGKVVLNLSDRVPILKLGMLIEGSATSTNGSCKESIYKNNLVLFGSSSDSLNGISHHPAGEQTYRFDILLPIELPSSVKEKHGQIEYLIKTKLEYKGLKSFLSSTQKLRKRFNVKEIIDANEYNYELLDVKTCRKVPGLFSNTTKLEKEDLLIGLKRGVCCPEENVEVNIQYKHVIAKKMGMVRVRLNKYMHFNKKDNRPPLKKIVAELADEKRRNDKIYQRTIKVNIPANTTPTNTLTNAVVINYVLHVKVEGYKEIKLPVIIGTIPYNEHIGDNSTSENNADLERSSTSTSHDTLSRQLPYAPTPTFSTPMMSPSPQSPSVFQLEHGDSFDQANAPPFYDDGAEIQCEFSHPPPYIPEDEFDLPPSYDEVIDSTSNAAGRQVVVGAH